MYEDALINSFPKKYVLNKTAGGLMSGLGEAIMYGKTR